MTFDETFMARAMELAREAARDGNEPFGALLVRSGAVVAEGKNQIHTRRDPTFHAELGLIRDYCSASGVGDLGDCTLYSSCEPCFMCSGALVWAKLGRLVFGAYDSDYCAIRGFAPNDCSKLIFELSPAAPEVAGGVLRGEGIAILREYFANR
jgi:tRNA(Arg) A34 adenosine deaminase TadA